MSFSPARLLALLTLGAVAGCATGVAQEQVIANPAPETSSEQVNEVPTQTVPAQTKQTAVAADSQASATAGNPGRTAATKPGADTSGGVPFAIKKHPIPYGPDRLAQMAEYSKRHYGVNSHSINPSIITLHYTEGDTWQSAFAIFAKNNGTRGEQPGVCAHYLVDQKGLILELVPPTIMCRHVIGLNHKAIGIEIVQNTKGKGSRWAEQQILARNDQIENTLTLVRKLQAQFGISTANIVGHATANDHPQFVDNSGWKNTHTDWGATSVAEFKARL